MGNYTKNSLKNQIFAEFTYNIYSDAHKKGNYTDLRHLITKNKKSLCSINSSFVFLNKQYVFMAPLRALYSLHMVIIFM